MTFTDREDYKQAAASEKITLATVEAKSRLYIFNAPVMNIYTKAVPNFVARLKQNDQELSAVNNKLLVTEGTFCYEITTGILHVRFFGDADPQTVEVVATYKLFYSSKALQTTHNLQNISEEVDWQGRIISSPGYKHKIGIDQSLTSLVGEGTLVLKNEDGELDNIFDDYIFENQEVVIYSWNTDLKPSESKVIYRGNVTNKLFNGERISFKIKDLVFSLLDAPSLEAYTNSDNVTEAVRGRYKRRVYGRVDGLRAQAIDQVAEGFSLTGTGSIGANSTTLLGNGTIFLQEVIQGDSIVVGTQQFTVESVDSDTQITVTDEADFAFAGQEMTLISSRGTTLKNRTFLGAGHICAKVNHNITEVPQFNRVRLDSTEGLFSGDFVEFVSTGERIEIKTIAPDNLVVLRQNMVTKPALGTQVVRQPVQEVYIGSSRVNSDDFTVFNNGSGCGITFDTDVEFNLARPKNTAFNGTFTNGSREVTIPVNEVSLSDIFTAGDFVKPDGITYFNFYKITHVAETSIFLSAPFVDPTVTDRIEIKAPEYLNDDSIVSLNILGKTEDGTESGTWIQTTAQATRDLLKDNNITAVNEQSFLDGAEDATQLVSMAVPFSFTSKKLPTIKELTDALNKSTHSSLTLDNELKLKYQVLNVYTDSDLPVIRDHDIKDWRIKTTNGKTYKTAQVKYRFSDVDLASLDTGNKFISFDSEFVQRYIGTNKVDELDIYLYEDRDAEISAHRHLYYNSLSVATMTLATDLRLENIEIGDVIIADLRRLYKRKGDNVRKKVMLVVGKTVTGEEIKLELSDLGNTFNTSSYITPNDAPDWVDASEDEKLIYGYITDNQGIVNNEEDSAGTHLIS